MAGKTWNNGSSGDLAHYSTPVRTQSHTAPERSKLVLELHLGGSGLQWDARILGVLFDSVNVHLEHCRVDLVKPALAGRARRTREGGERVRRDGNVASNLFLGSRMRFGGQLLGFESCLL